MLHIHPDNGFEEIPTKSISSKVFKKEGKVYKINKRNSFERALSDWNTIQSELSEFSKHIPETKISTCLYQNEEYTCIKQDLINGKELFLFTPEEINSIFKKKVNREFIKKLATYFFDSIKSKNLYPDIVGNPSDPHILNSVNLIVDESGHLILCDVGLSPHEDTLSKQGEAFFESDNVKLYVKRIEDSIRDLELTQD